MNARPFEELRKAIQEKLAEERKGLPPRLNIPLYEAVRVREKDLRWLLWRLTRNWADVEELLQETYIRLLQAFPDKVPNAHGLAFRTARNLAYDRWRHEKVVPLELAGEFFEKDQPSDDLALVQRIVEGQQEVERILIVARRFTERQREIFILRKIYGYTQKQIAERLKIAEHTVEHHLHLCARQLANALGNTPAPITAVEFDHDTSF
jgi:RNA polymerase sigma-70 factor (ECF subfamily)